MSALRGFLSQECWARIGQNTFGWLPWCERKSCWWCLTSECLQSSTSYQFRCMNRISKSRTSVVVIWLNLTFGLHRNRECVHFLPPKLLKVTFWHFEKLTLCLLFLWLLRWYGVHGRWRFSDVITIQKFFWIRITNAIFCNNYFVVVKMLLFFALFVHFSWFSARFSGQRWKKAQSKHSQSIEA